MYLYLTTENDRSMTKERKLLIFDRALDLFTHLGLPGDCIDHKIESSILNLGSFPKELPYTSPFYRANFYSFVFIKNVIGKCSSDGNGFNLKPGNTNTTPACYGKLAS